MEDALAGEWEPEGHQLRDHLPGGRVVGEEATVPGGADAGRETTRGGPGSVPGEELPARPPRAVCSAHLRTT